VSISNPCVELVVVADLLHRLLNLMHRVIDDFESEWAPEVFSGKRWSPLTRPRYTRAIPSRTTFERKGRRIPVRLPPCPQDVYDT
jgi:hypothetical protein